MVDPFSFVIADCINLSDTYETLKWLIHFLFLQPIASNYKQENISTVVYRVYQIYNLNIVFIQRSEFNLLEWLQAARNTDNIIV